MYVSHDRVLTCTRAPRLGRYLLRDVDETLWAAASIVLDAAVGLGVFDRCDVCSKLGYFCWYVYLVLFWMVWQNVRSD